MLRKIEIPFSNTDYKAEDMFNTIIKVFECNGLDISNCQGQSYDNSSNMSGVLSPNSNQRTLATLILSHVLRTLWTLSKLMQLNIAIQVATFFCFCKNCTTILVHQLIGGMWDLLRRSVPDNHDLSTLISLLNIFEDPKQKAVLHMLKQEV